MDHSHEFQCFFSYLDLYFLIKINMGSDSDSYLDLVDHASERAAADVPKPSEYLLIPWPKHHRNSIHFVVQFINVNFSKAPSVNEFGLERLTNARHLLIIHFYIC